MIRSLISFTALAFALGAATAQTAPAASAPAGAAYPAKPVRLIVPFRPAAAPTSSPASWRPS